MKKYMVVSIFNRELIDTKVCNSLDEAKEYMRNDFEKYKKDQAGYGDWGFSPNKCAWASIDSDYSDWYIIPIE